MGTSHADLTPPAMRAAYAQSLAPYLEAFERIAHEALLVELVRHGGHVRVGGLGKAVEELARLIQSTQQTADLLGRSDVLKTARRLVGGTPPPVRPPPGLGGATPEPLGFGGAGLPRVPFNEAVADVLAREPALLQGAHEVATAYNESHVFGMARAVEQETVTRAQKAIARAIHKGIGAQDVAKDLRKIARQAGEDMADWTRAYAETVAETNMATAFSAGRFRQMADPAVASVIGALMFDGPNDSSARPNHVAALGLIAAPDDPIWDILAPPLGFRCRHGLSFVDWATCRSLGLVLANGRIRRARVPTGAHADPGFKHKGRPDRAIYGHA